MRKNITEETRSLGALLRLPYERLLQHVYDTLAQRGFPDIRPAHSALFRHILPEGSRATDLAARSRMTKQSMAYLVDYLAERGYVTFVPDPSDGRAKLVVLTERGQAATETLLAISGEAEADAAQALGAAELQTLRDLLERLDASLRAGALREPRGEAAAADSDPIL